MQNKRIHNVKVEQGLTKRRVFVAKIELQEQVGFSLQVEAPLLLFRLLPWLL